MNLTNQKEMVLMHMTTQEIVNEFTNGATEGVASGGRLTIQGDKLVNYSTVIAQRLDDGSYVINVTKYSPTTSKHQNRLKYALCRYDEVDDMPVGIQDLV